MRYLLDYINIGLIKKLQTDNSIEYPSGTQILVYTEVANDADFPVILIEPSTSTEDRVTRDSIGQTYVMNVEVISKFKQGQGGWGQNSNIMNQILPLIRSKNSYLDLSGDGLKVINQTTGAIQPLREAYSDGVYYRTIVQLELEIEEL